MANDRTADSRRQDPDVILAEIKEQTRGKLTIFLGPIAGVGKTYAMLQSAQERLTEGVDVVIGLIETHGRKDTAALAEGLPMVPRKKIEYHGIVLDEMDVDGILARKPELVLVDELAHTNIPGTRHPRRYLDVEELLEAGIDVYTTLNIQHIESLNDAVAGITGIVVRETVPDQFIERAAFVRSIDIPAEELQRRLKDGKVYIPDSIEKALRNFFRTGNISALRELALRYAAERVDYEVENYRRRHDINQPWHTGELVIACTSTNPFGSRVLRTAKRLAGGLHSKLLVVNVESGRRRSEQDEQNLALNIKLAEEMGADIVTLYGEDIPREILKLAFDRNATEIVVGKPLNRNWRQRFKPSMVDRIIGGSQGISVHVVPGDPLAKARKTVRGIHFEAPSFHYLVALAMVAAITAIAKLLHLSLQAESGGNILDLTNIAMLFILPVVYAAAKGGFGPAVFASIAGVLAFDIFFVPPTGTVTVSQLKYLVSFVVLLVVGFTIATIANRLRLRAEDSRKREATIQALFNMAKELTAITDVSVITEIVVNHISVQVEGEILFYVPDRDGGLKVSARSHPEATETENENESAVASWSYQHSEVAGRGTETLPGARCVYVPVSSEGHTLGVIAACLSEKKKIIESRQKALLEAFAGLAALSLSRAELVRFGQEVHHLEESERLRTALLNSVSHDLRTPLSAIMGAATSLLDNDIKFSSEAERSLLEEIATGAARMDRTTGNLLAMARLESGLVTLNLEWCDIEDILGVVLEQYKNELTGRKVNTDTPTEANLIRADYGLIERVISNLIDNALKYSPDGTDIFIRIDIRDGSPTVSVADSGPGLPGEDMEKIFDKFYRIKRDSGIGGTGLGLSICKSIVEAHGGRIWAKNRSSGGAVISFTLPAEGPEIPEDNFGVPIA